MIVYGDSDSPAPFAELRSGFRSLLAEATVHPSEDGRRTLAIEAGRLEQATEDGLPEAAEACRRLTEAAVRAFLGGGDLASVAEALERVPASDTPVIAKTPEGFAFYGLYPESYAAAARLWIAAHEGASNVLVVGVRSIGTMLSSVVAESLRAAGVQARRCTVRPTGHPFAREAEIAPEVRADATWALVVDEGPGLSGSSMAAVGEALVRIGFSHNRIAFFPGHGGEPGVQASAGVRAWWRETPRFVVPTEALRWDDLTLEGLLLARTGEATGIEELSGGRWREFVYRDEATWPAVVAAFERRKLRVTRSDGSATLWKFVGLAVPGTTLGFARTPWIEGEPLRREDATPETIAFLGRHLAVVAGPPLPPNEADAAKERLWGMLRTNAEEAGIALDIPACSAVGGPSAGDYRLAPGEWRRSPDGEIVKVGRIAPTLDHTLVGRQPLAWDVAGAMVEWDLDDPTGLPPVPPRELRFYRAAYAAIRIGQCAMFAGDGAEGHRLRREAAFYRAALERLL